LPPRRGGGRRARRPRLALPGRRAVPHCLTRPSPVARMISGYAAYRFLVRVKHGRWLPEPGEIVVLDLGRTATIHDLRWVRGRSEIVEEKLVVIAPLG